ncbi:MAG: hypothetical protein ACI93P_002027, partial [bacterium]
LSCLLDINLILAVPKIMNLTYYEKNIPSNKRNILPT